MAEQPQPTPEPPLDEDGVLEPRSDDSEAKHGGDSPFPVVGIGASAGGLEAFKLLLEHLPADTGMAFVFVQHLAPRHSSLLASILTRSTSMAVTEVTQNTHMVPNHVYVIPPNTLMQISDSTLELKARPEERGAPRPIDYFMRSLAQDRQTRAIGVLLSGADADGSLGLQAIREQGGITLVQSIDSAKSPEMPRLAIDTGAVDLVLSPQDIGAELGRIAANPLLATPPRADGSRRSRTNPLEAPPAVLTHLFQLMRRTTGVDYSGYKYGTLRRRIARRMLLRRDESLDSYLASLESDRAERLALSEDILIHVTSFFRDDDAFEAFEHNIVPSLLVRGRRKVHDNTPFRVWVPGCSTGQEVYSIAMSLLEAMARNKTPAPIQIFGTDLSERCVNAARNAVYSEAEVLRLSPERQTRFFVRADGAFQIIKSVREMCVFARQNLLADPPFSRLDLVSCRNVLIYLVPAMQRHVIATFHYALQPGGCLWLGQSESLRDFPDLFSQIDKTNRFYLRNEARDSRSLQVLRSRSPGDRSLTVPLLDRERTPEAEMEKTAERIVLSEFGPAWVLANQNFDVINSRGDVGPYLQVPSGRVTLSLLRMARDEIRGELIRLLGRAKAGESAIRSVVLRRGNGDGLGECTLEVRRLPRVPGTGDASDSAYLIVFLPGVVNRGAAPAEAAAQAPPELVAPGELERVRQELGLANQRLQTIVSERDAANHELTSANEEIQSSNEELQSINEELETSKEELQSSNEELNTVNEELQTRNQELVRIGDDLANLLSSITMPILMLDNELRIRRVTQAAERLFNIRQSDVGRPLSDIRLRLSGEDLDAMVHRVIETLAGEEVELPDRDGRWHLLRVRPYRTGNNRIEGAVLVMIDIDQMRHAQHEADAARAFAESLIQAVQTPLLVLNRDLRVRAANRAFLNGWHLGENAVAGRALSSLNSGGWVSADLEKALTRLSRNETPTEDLECVEETPGAPKRVLAIHASEFRPDHESDGDFQILLAIADVTAQRHAEKIMQEDLSRTESALHGSEVALRRSGEELRALAASLLNAQEEERRRVSRELHDDVGQNVAKLQFDIETLEQSLPPESKTEKKALLSIRDTAASLSNDLRRIAYALHPSVLDHLGLNVALRAYAREFSKRSGISAKLTTARVPPAVSSSISNCFYRIVQEALRNVAKHAPRSTRVSIDLKGAANRLVLTIRDDGPGFDSETVRGNGGLGLIGIQERARLIHARFELSTSPGNGTAIKVSAPLTDSADANNRE